VDLSVEEEVQALAAWAAKESQRITLLHAAALSRDALAIQAQTSDWDAVMNVNLRAGFLLARELLKPMMQARWGRVVLFSSVAALRGVPGTLAYSTAKSGLLGMSRVIAREYARYGITSNVLALGYFNTGLIDTLAEKARSRILEDIPSTRLGSVGDIVNAVECLIKSEYINGSVLAIDGGI
jgi:3-oxoacyl-[acyl-carrier protein] reductase